MMSLWLSDFQDLRVEPSVSAQSWLRTNTSITEKAKSFCQSVRVEVLSERWEVQEKQKNFVREVLILCDGKPAWYAQTFIPEKTYALRAEQFQNLHDKPIATILFHDPHITRQDFVYAYLTPSNAEYRQAIQYYKNHKNQTPTFLWARKSVFLIDNQESLSIMEVFYPNILDKQ